MIDGPTAQVDLRGGRTPAATAPKKPTRFGLEFDDGSFLVARGRGLVGRDPARSGERPTHLVKLTDPTCSVSRTHLEFGVGNTGLWVRDRHSTNGSDIEFGGKRIRLTPGLAVPVRPTSTIHFGGRRIRVETVVSRADVGAVTIEWGAATRVGAKRGHNQDTFGARPPVFVVADGIGSHSGGDLASREAVHALLTLAGRQPVTPEKVYNALADARARIARIPARQSDRPPGTTISGVILTHRDDAPCWMVVNMGDSRTYRLDASGLCQLTVDHSIAQKLIDAGVIEPSRPGRRPFQNMLSRALFGSIEHSPDLWHLPADAGDRILVCSDGLSSVVDDATVQNVLQSMRDPQAAADELVRTATDAGGRDDVTVVVVDALAVRPPVDADSPTTAIHGGLATVTRARWRT